MSRWVIAALGLGLLAVSGTATTSAAARAALDKVVIQSMSRSHVSGTATVAYDAKKHATTVILHLRGLTSGIHFAHIHIGRCGGNGDVKYALAPLQASRSDTAASVTVLPYQLVGSALHINVHGVPNQVLKIVACGNL